MAGTLDDLLQQTRQAGNTQNQTAQTLDDLLRQQSANSMPTVETPEIQTPELQEPEQPKLVQFAQGTKNRLDDTLLAGGGVVGSGMLNTAARISEWLDKASGQENRLTSLLNEKAGKMSSATAALTESAKEGKGKLQNFLVDLGVAGTGMLVDVATGAPLTSMFVRTFGNESKKALDEGATDTQAALYGAAKGLISVGVEKLGSGLDAVYGKSVTSGIWDDIASKLAKTNAGQTVIRTLLGAASEGGEEVLEDIADPLAKIIYDKGEALKNTYTTEEGFREAVAEAGYDFLVGSALGGLGGAVEAMRGGEQTTRETAEAPQTEAPQVETPTEAQPTQAEAQPAEPVQAPAILHWGDQINETITSGNYSKAASMILSNPALRAQFESEFGALDTSNEAARRQIAETLYSEMRRPATQEVVQEAVHEPVVEQEAQIEAEPQVEAQEPNPSELLSYAGNESYVRGLMMNMTPAAANEILRSPSLRSAWESLNGRKLPQSNNLARQAILSARTAPGSREVLGSADPLIRSLMSQRETQVGGTNAVIEQDADGFWRASVQQAPGVDALLDAVRESSVDGRADVSDVAMELGVYPGTANSMIEEYINEGKLAEDRDGLYIPDESTLEESRAEAAAWAWDVLSRIAAQQEAEEAAQGTTEETVESAEPEVVEEASVEETPVEAQPVQEAPAEEAPAQETAEEKPKERKPRQPKQTQQAPTIETVESEDYADLPRGFDESRNRGRERNFGFAETVAENPLTPEDLAAELRTHKYNQEVDKDTLARVTEIFNKGLPYAQGKVREYLDLAKYKNQKLPREIFVLGPKVARALALNGDTVAANEILADLEIEANIVGRQMEIMRYNNSYSPQTAIRTLEKAAEEINSRIPKNSGWKAELTEAEIEQANNTDFNEEGAFEAFYGQVAKRWGEECPSSLWDKITEFRRVAMLLNPKTDVRNVVANIPMQILRRIADKISGGIQDVLVSMGVLDKAKQTSTWKFSQADKKLGTEIYNKYSEQILNGANRYDVQKLFGQYRKYFNGTPLQFMDNGRELTYRILEAGDTPFVRDAFIGRLARYIAAQGYTDAASVPMSVIDNATQAAYEATFKDASELATMLNRLKRNGGVVGKALDVLFPFTTTPINLARRTIDYSPAGIIKVFAKIKNGAEMSEVIDSLAKAMTGSGIMALGFLLRRLGIITGGKDDDDKVAAWNKATGESPYSFNGKISYDWAQPVGTTLAIGAEIADAADGEGTVPEAIKKAIYSGGDAFLNMTFFQNILQLFENKYDSTTGQFVNQVIQSGASQLIPSIVGAAARTKDPTVRATFSKADTQTGNLINQLKSKIPGMSEGLAPSINVKGEENRRAENSLTRAFNEFINPSTVNQTEKTALDSFIDALYEETGSSTVLPDVAGYNVELSGAKHALTTQERAAYQQTMGQSYMDIMADMANSSTFSSLTAEEKAKAVEKARSYSKYLANAALANSIGQEYSNADWDNKALMLGVLKGNENFSPATYFSLMGSYGSSSAGAYMNMIYSGVPQETAEAVLYVADNLDLKDDSRFTQENVYSIINAFGFTGATADAIWNSCVSGKTKYQDYKPKKKS